MKNNSPLKTALAKIKRARKLRLLVSSACRIIAGGGIGYAGGVFGAHLLPLGYQPWVFGAFVLLGVLSGVVAAAQGLRFGRFFMDDFEAARILAGDDSDLANILLTGADLSGWNEEDAKKRGADPSLVAEGVALAEKSGKTVTPAKTGPQLTLDLQLFGVALFCVVVTVFFGPPPPGGTVAAILGPKSQKIVSVGNISVTYNPPAYTGLPLTTEEGGGGEVRGYAGTRVTLAAQLSEGVDSGVFVGPDKVKIPLTVNGTSFTVDWSLKVPGVYELHFYKNGLEIPSGFAPAPVTVVADNAPEVELIAPVSDVEAMNVDEIKVEFRAGDDFKVERAEILLSGKVEERIPLRVTPGMKTFGSAVFLPAAYPKLGDGAYLSVEAWDNDDVSGPKKGVSRSVYVAFYNPARLAAEMEGMEERILEAMLSYLADHLENPAPSHGTLEDLKATGENLKKLVEALTTAVKKRVGGEITRFDGILNIEATLLASLDGWFKNPQAARPYLIAELERDILFLDRLIKELRMEQALSLGDELNSLQQDLYERLMRGEDMTALAEAVNQIEKMLNEINKKLGDKESLPDEFANSDAVKEMPKDSLAEMLEELKKALRDGDRKKAAELAEKILKELDKWMKSMEQAADGEMSDGDSETSQKLDEIGQKLAQAMAEQERIMGKTRATADELSKKLKEELKNALASFIKKQKDRLDAIARDQYTMEVVASQGLSQDDPPEKQLERLKRLGEERNRLSQIMRQVRASLDEALGEVPDEARRLERQLASFEAALNDGVKSEQAEKEVRNKALDAIEKARQISHDIEGLLGSRKDRAGVQEQSELKTQGADENKLAGDIDSIAEELSKLSESSPFVLPGAGQKAGEAGQSAKGAGKSLGGSDPFSALPQQMETLERLSELSSDMERMQESMGKGKSGKKPSHMRRPGSRSGRGQDVDKSKVEIPGEAESVQLKKLREEVMRAMRQGNYPKEYEREIERYFEGLIK